MKINEPIENSTEYNAQVLQILKSIGADV